VARLYDHIASLVAPGGVFILSACASSNAYAVGERYFPCAGVDESDVLSSCARDNSSTIDLRVRQVPAQTEQGFSSVIFASAVKGQRSASGLRRFHRQFFRRREAG
jgi:hypothetical protein